MGRRVSTLLNSAYSIVELIERVYSSFFVFFYEVQEQI